MICEMLRCTLTFFLSGFHWHLSGLSELPLEQRILPFLAGEPFLPHFIFLRRFVSVSFRFFQFRNRLVQAYRPKVVQHPMFTPFFEARP